MNAKEARSTSEKVSPLLDEIAIEKRRLEVIHKLDLIHNAIALKALTGETEITFTNILGHSDPCFPLTENIISLTEEGFIIKSEQNWQYNECKIKW